MVPVSPAVSALERLELALHPSRVDEVVAAASDSDLQLLYLQARSLGRLSWVTMAIVAGQAVERADAVVASGGPRTATSKAVALAFGVARSEISRAAKIYRRIIKPRLVALGEEANFTIDGRTYYEIAIEASEYSGQEAADLIVRAEDGLAIGGYSCRKFRQALIEDGLLPAPEGAEDGDTLDTRVAELRGLLQRMATIEDDVIVRASETCGSDEAFVEWATDAELLIASLIERIGRR